jgi:hypothetical protein
VLVASLLAASLLSFSGPDSHELRTIPVGNFGGFRALVGCDLSSDGGLCLVDTASHWSILRSRLPLSKTVGSELIRGIGLKVNCSVEEAPKVRIGQKYFEPFKYLHCPDFPVAGSPLIGANDLTQEPVQFSFSTNSLNWGAVKPKRGVETKAWFLSERQRWILFNLHLGDSQPVVAAWDTGAPVTLVDHSFVAENPRYFQASDIAPTERMRNRGGVPYRLTLPLMVNGANLGMGYVHAYDLKGIFGANRGGADILIGMNHIAAFDWWIDTKNNEMMLVAPGNQ